MLSNRIRVFPSAYSVLCKIRGSETALRYRGFKGALVCVTPYSTDGAASVAQPEYYASKHFWKVHELVSQGQYADALDTWDQQKARGETDKYMYTPLMRLASILKSSEAANALKADMTRQNWEMDAKCTLHYLSALIADGRKAEAFDYLHHQSALKDQPQFLTSVAKCFFDRAEPELALRVCQLGGGSPDLLAMQVEVLGHLQNVEGMQKLVDGMYSGVSKAPVEVQLGVAYGLALANLPQRSLDVVSGLVEMGVTVPPKCAALLLEACKRKEDTVTAAEVYHRVWTASCSMEVSKLDFTQASIDFTLYLLRAMNAAIHLQALALRDLQAQGSQPCGRMKAFVEHGFVAELKADALLPDIATYEALLLHCCFQPRTKSSADLVIKTCTMTGRPLPASALTSWTKHCGALTPKQVKQMLKIVRIHSHHFDISLGAEQLADLLSVRYAKGSDGQGPKETLECIRDIKNLMRANPALVSTQLYNDVLSAIARTGDMGALYTTYKEMIVHKVPANARTYHALLDCCLTSGKKHAGKGAAYYTWRNLVKEFPAIELDVGLLNKFVQCCLQCRDAERALFFLSVFDEGGMLPNVETFQMLLKACRLAENQEKFQVVVALALQCLPQHATVLSAFAEEVEREWKNARDLALAEQILTSQLRSC